MRSGRVSAVELVEAHLQQIERANPRINAFVSVLADQARAQARQRDAQHEARGPLHGVPVTIKDSFDIEGLSTLCGSKFRIGHLGARNATAVERLLNAGAVILGKTNCGEFLHAYESDNYIIGRTNNPWNPDLTAGGSSGGEAAAIATFCSAGGIGSDGGGSIRIPAHFCGIAGLKPTPGRVSAAGHFPDICHPGGLLGVAGPMARTAADVRALFEVLAGYDSADPFSAPVPLRIPSIEGLRVGVMEQFYRVPVQPAVRAAVRKAARALDDLRIATDAFEPKGMERAPNVWAFFFDQPAIPYIRKTIAGRERDAHWTSTEFLEFYRDKPAPTAEDVFNKLAERDRLRSSMIEQMRETPVLLMPAAGITAFPHRQRRYETNEKAISQFEATMTATTWNLFGFPGLVIPFDVTPEGIPVGIQLVGRPWEEELLLELAVRLEEVRGPFGSPPGY